MACTQNAKEVYSWRGQKAGKQKGSLFRADEKQAGWLGHGPVANRQPKPPAHCSKHLLVTILPGCGHLRYAGWRAFGNRGRRSMTINIELGPDEERALSQRAQGSGRDLTEYVHQI